MVIELLTLKLGGRSLRFFSFVCCLCLLFCVFVFCVLIVIVFDVVCRYVFVCCCALFAFIRLISGAHAGIILLLSGPGLLTPFHGPRVPHHDRQF